MVALADVRLWNADALETVVTDLATARDAITELDYQLAEARNPPDWSGTAAEAATREHDRLAERLRRYTAAASAVRRGVADATDSIAALHDGIAVAEGLAGANGFAVALDGTVTDVAPPVVAPELVESVTRERTAISVEIVDRLEQVLRNAEVLDTDLAFVLSRAETDEIDDGDATTTLAQAAFAGEVAGALPGAQPPPSGSPGDNAGWWTSLSPAARAQVVRDHPEWIGNRDGIPAADRDAANRSRLDARVGEIDSQIAAARQGIADIDAKPFWTRTPADTITAAALRVRLDQLDGERATYGEVENVLGRPDRHLLTLDLDRDHPRAAVAVGDVDTADHVAVFTPGFTSNVRDSLGSYDTQVEGLQRTATNELRRVGSDDTVAAVTWIGYDAPQWDDGAAVLSPESARQGGAELAGVLDGINASRADDPHLTAVGHSYGSTTTGYALQQATGVDDGVLYGSPGSSGERIGDFNLPPERLAVIEAQDDYVTEAGIFGTDPGRLDGAVGLSAFAEQHPDGTPLQQNVGHNEYLTPGTTSQYNIAATIAGLYDERIEGGAVQAEPVEINGVTPDEAFGPFTLPR